MDRDRITSWEAEPRQLEAIIAGLAEGLVVIHPERREVLYLNGAAQALLGFDSVEQGKQTVEWYREHFPLSHLDGRAVPADERPIARILRGETFTNYELQVMRLGEVDPWIGLFNGSLVQDTTTLGVMTMQDVSAWREAEQSFRTVFQASPAATAIVRLDDLMFVDINASFTRLTGYSYAEVVGRSAPALKMDIESKKRDIARRQNESGVLGPLEMDLRHRDGHTLRVLTTGEVIRLGGVPHLLDTFVDVTQQRQTEEELMRAIEEVMQDTNWFSRTVVEKLANLRMGQTRHHGYSPVLEELTPRERQVLARLAQGHSNAQIATEMGVALNTVRNYVTNIYAKIGVHSRTEAVVWARERGIVS